MSTEAAGEAKQETVEAGREKAAAIAEADEASVANGTAERSKRGMGSGSGSDEDDAEADGPRGATQDNGDGEDAGSRTDEASAGPEAGGDGTAVSPAGVEQEGPGLVGRADADETDAADAAAAGSREAAAEAAEASVGAEAGGDGAAARPDAGTTAAGDETAGDDGDAAARDGADGDGAAGRDGAAGDADQSGAADDAAEGEAGDAEGEAGDGNAADEADVRHEDGAGFAPGEDGGPWPEDEYDGELDGDYEAGRAGRVRRWPRVLLVTGFVLAAVAIVGGAIAIVGSVTHGFKKPVKVTYKKSALFSLQTGDCFDSRGQAYSLTSCDVAHEAEVFATFSLTGDKYPGSTAIAATAGQGCASRLTSYLNPQLAISLASTYVYPDATAWQAGTRTVICEVRASSGELTGSVRAASATAG